MQSGQSVYAYVGNDPLNLVDPFGLAAERGGFGTAVGQFGSAVVGTASAFGDRVMAGETWRDVANYGLTGAVSDMAMVVGGAGVAGAKIVGSAARGIGEASSLANAARLRGQLAGQEIAGGHAFEKHLLNLGEFKGLGIRTRQQFANHIENVVNNPTAARQLSGGRTAYWQESSGTVVIRNPRAADGGTAFQPTNSRAYFDGLR